VKIRISRSTSKKAGQVFYYIILTILVIIAGLTAISNLKIPGNYKLLVAMSGSMEPSVKTGSIFVVKPQSHYQPGDIITFYDQKNSKSYVTHRLVQVSDNNQFITKGDANSNTDTKTVNQGQILGKTVFTIPQLGFLVNYSKTTQGLIITIIIPAVIIIYNELISIKNEAKRLIIERRRRKLSLKERVEETVGEEIIRIEESTKKEIEKIVDEVRSNEKI